MKKTIGVFAHIDAGKTTFCEQLLYLGGAIRKVGRVDHGDSFFDSDSIERQRGVTIFAHEGRFCFQGSTYVLIDTPGHADFAAEAERAAAVLDAAIVLVDGTEGVRPQTRLLFRLLQRRKTPCFFFINKKDMPACNVEAAYAQIKSMLTDDAVLFDETKDLYEQIAEQIALRDEVFLEAYLAQQADEAMLWKRMCVLVREGALFPVCAGSALMGDGIAAFLSVLDRLCVTDYCADAPLRARVFRVRRDGQMTAFVKVEQGVLHVRDAFYMADETYKVSLLQRYQDVRFESVAEVCAGDVAAVCGLPFAEAGMLLLENGRVIKMPQERTFWPVMRAAVNCMPQQQDALAQALLTLTREDPALDASCDADTGEYTVGVMGQLQEQVLMRRLADRFGIMATLCPPRPAYRETIDAPVLGIGHYEPLRHYAEVMLALVPAPRGAGVTAESLCHVDDLPMQYQNAILTQLLTRVHRGMLIGAPLCDVKVFLLEARVHQKHTEGGDLRQAAWRAVRQALEKVTGVLLEPYCRFEIAAPQTMTGRLMADMQTLHAAFDAPQTQGESVLLCGRAPGRLLNGYAQTLAAASGGQAGMSVWFDGYDRCGDAQVICEHSGYDAARDTANPSGSVFCQKGAGFAVDWRQADTLSHLRDGRSDLQILRQYGILQDS